MEPSERGIWVVLQRKSGGSVEGWLIGELRQGYLIARDQAQRDVSFVPASDMASIGYDRHRQLIGMKVQGDLHERLQGAADVIQRPLGLALERVRFGQLHRLGRAAVRLRDRIRWEQYRARQDGWTGEPDELIAYLELEVDRVTELHAQVFETLEDSGVAQVLDEYGGQLSALPPEFTLPAHDLEFASHEDLVRTLESAQESPWSRDQHQKLLAAVAALRDQLLKKRDVSSAAEPAETKPADDSTMFSRWIGPSLRILAGSTLTVANAALGVSAPFVAKLITIGGMNVPAYVGVATSMFTGLIQVADGLEKMSRRR